MKVAIGNDHVGILLKEAIVEVLNEKNIEVVDCGTNSTQRCDYPVYAKKVAHLVASGTVDKGIVLCGTGVGISIAANKVNGVRCVVCSEPYSAQLSRTHNNTNMLSLGSRVVGVELAKMITRVWLESEFEGGRHQHRVEMIAEIEKENRS